MTWGEFKKEVESQSVKDSDEIWYIDISLPQVGELFIDNSKENGLAIQ